MRQKSKTNKTLLDSIEDVLGRSIIHDDEVRFSNCPSCGDSKNNPALSINMKKQVFKCHKCGLDGTLSHLAKTIGVEYKNKPILISTEDDLKKIERANEIWKNAKPISMNSKTTDYLRKRGIEWRTLQGLEIKENCQRICIVGIKNRKKELIGLNCREIIDSSAFSKRYVGRKKGGAAVLRDSDQVIVAEGIVTGLAVLHKIGQNRNMGLVVAGDAGNLPNIAWALKGKSRVLICADNDFDGQGLRAATDLYSQLGTAATLHVPIRKGTDWADVLNDGRWNHEWNT